MGLLDDLRQQSASLQEKEQREKERREHAEHIYHTKTVPALNRLYDTLNELAKHLNYIKPEIPVSYVFNVDGYEARLMQEEYQATIDSKNNPQLVNFNCRCMHPKEIAFKVGGKNKVEENLQFLKKARLIFQFKPEKNEYHEVVGAHFLVKPSLPVIMNFKPDIDNCCVRMTLQNFGDLSVRSHAIQPERITDDFLDRLSRFIVREVDDLFNEKVTDETRERLRAQIEAEQRQRQEELNQAEQDSLAHEKHLLEEGVFGFIKKRNAS